MDGTDIRAGIIGEIGAEEDYLTAAEERVFRAAARAHKQTHAAIVTSYSRRWDTNCVTPSKCSRGRRYGR